MLRSLSEMGTGGRGMVTGVALSSQPYICKKSRSLITS